MITLAENKVELLDYLKNFDAENPFCVEIISQLKSYTSKFDFVDYWMIKSESKQNVGAIARYGTVFTLFLDDSKYSVEVCRFLKAIGASKIICDKNAKLDFLDSRVSSGPILFRNISFLYDENRFQLCVPNLKEYYKILSESEDKNFTPPTFEDFYVDLNHKLRHNTVRAIGVDIDDELAAAIMTLAESEGAALLGGLACLKKHRKKGIGSFLIKTITNLLINEGKTVFLYRAQNANIDFYNRLGFSVCGAWQEFYI